MPDTASMSSARPTRERRLSRRLLFRNALLPQKAVDCILGVDNGILRRD